MTLGDLIKKYRTKRNISMDEFSKMCNLSKGYISMLENNINPRNNKPIAPTLPTIKKISSAMNTDVDSILKVLDTDQEIVLDFDPKTTVGFERRIKERRVLMGLTQEELAKKLGLQKSAIAKYENGRVENIKRSVIANMAKVLQCSPAYLMGWEDESSNLSAHTYHLSSKEELLLIDFRTLNEQGQDYILQTMDMVKDKYKKSNMLSDMEEIV